MIDEQHSTTKQKHTDVHDLEGTDALYVRYLDDIDLYVSSRTDLSKYMSQGFLKLAKSNYDSGSKRYGKDYYDHKTKATITVKMRGVELILNKTPITESTIHDKEDKSLSSFNETMQQEEESPSRKFVKTSFQENTDENGFPENPIRMFGILVPHSLREAQHEFQQAVAKMIDIVNASRHLEKSANELELNENLARSTKLPTVKN